MRRSFTVDQLVVWVESGLPLTTLRKLKEVGKGPFRVFKIQLIPAGVCSCGVPVDDPSHIYYYFCSGSTERQNEGHHQRLAIKDQRGRIIKDQKGLPRFFSGALFRVIE